MNQYQAKLEIRKPILKSYTDTIIWAALGWSQKIILNNFSKFDTNVDYRILKFMLCFSLISDELKVFLIQMTIAWPTLLILV